MSDQMEQQPESETYFPGTEPQPSDVERPTDRPFYSYSRHTIWILLLCLLGVVVAGTLFWRERQRLAGESKAAGDINMEREELAGANLGRISSKVYFLGTAGHTLQPLPRQIFAARAPEVRARQLVQALIEGPLEGESQNMLPVLPKQTKIRQIFMLKDGTMIVDLSEEVVNLLPGGIDSEVTAMESIERTLLENEKAIKAVRFLINGKDTETFAGHIAVQVTG
ncbi:MAG TPA: GerMN domain-containing protein [Acidobacteriota bacterium]|jgi:hypothetical protein